MQNVINVVLSHRAPNEVQQLAVYWESLLGGGNVLMAYGGPGAFSTRLSFNPKIFIDYTRLRTLDGRAGEAPDLIYRDGKHRLKSRKRLRRNSIYLSLGAQNDHEIEHRMGKMGRTRSALCGR